MGALSQFNWLVLINPVAGKRNAHLRWKKLSHYFNHAGIRHTPFITKGKRYAESLCLQKLSSYNAVLSIGGDGTNNEVINGLMRHPDHHARTVVFGHFPVGSSNDLARYYKIPTNVDRWIYRMEKSKTIKQDLGKVIYGEDSKQVRYFANVAGIAYDAFIAKNTTRNGLASWKYFIAIFKHLNKYNPQEVIIDSAEKRHKGYTYTINFGITPYSGGGMQIVPHAVPDDGLLAVTLVGKLPKWKIPINALRLFNGHIGKLKAVSQWQTKEALLKPGDNNQEEVYLEVDGEWIGAIPCKFMISQHKLNMLIPD
jgi:diacylglycerol kinase (ATP)